MRINSQFRDYYDTSIGYGVDNHVVYDRASRELDYYAKTGESVPIIADIKESVERFERLKGDCGLYSMKAAKIYIGFCGKVYQGLVAHINNKSKEIDDYPRRGITSTETIMWRLKDVPESILDSKLVRWSLSGSKSTFREWFNDENVRCYEDVALFTKQQMVSFIYMPDKVIINPRLKDFEFQRLVGAVEAFQEISMFISGVLGAPGKPMIELQDKDRIVAHGFDEQSFRQAEHPRKSKKGKV